MKLGGNARRVSLKNHCLEVGFLTNGVIPSNYEQLAAGVASDDEILYTDGLGCVRGIIAGCLFQIVLVAVGAACWELLSLLR
jgi:hypothetical protein